MLTSSYTPYVKTVVQPHSPHRRPLKATARRLPTFKAHQLSHADALRKSIAKYLASLGMDAQITSSDVADRAPTPIWLDCDTGHDDAFAILLAARCPEVRLVGISTVYGNASLEHTTYNTRAILEAIGRTDVPVYAGASRPFAREPCYAPGIHGQSGLDGTACLPQPTVPAQGDVTAIEAMYRALSAQPKGKAWLVATGALTNVAELFTHHPDLADHLGGLSVMGGAVGGNFTDAKLGRLKGEGERFGNQTPYAEFNVYCDPEAAETLFSNPKLAKKTTLVTLDLTHQFLATNEVNIGLLGFGGKMRGEPTMDAVSSVRRLFFEIINFFAKTYADVFGFTTGPPTHDPLAVAAAFRPDLFFCGGALAEDRSNKEQERFGVQVVLDGEHGTADVESTSQCGRTIATRLPPGAQGITIPRSLSPKAVWSLIESCLSHTERAIDEARTAGSQNPTPRRFTGHSSQKQFEEDQDRRAHSSDATDPARFAHTMSRTPVTKKPYSPTSDNSHNAISRDSGNDNGSIKRRDNAGGEQHVDMPSLVHGPNTTLSQFEMEAGTFPDIKGRDTDRGGEFLSTNKEGTHGQMPVEPTKRRSGSVLDADPSDLGSGGAKRNG